MLSHSASVLSGSAAPWTVAHQTPLSRGFPKDAGVGGHAVLQGSSRPRVEPASLRSPSWQVGSLPLAPPGKPKHHPFSSVAQSCPPRCDPKDYRVGHNCATELMSFLAKAMFPYKIKITKRKPQSCTPQTRPTQSRPDPAPPPLPGTSGPQPRTLETSTSFGIPQAPPQPSGAAPHGGPTPGPAPPACREHHHPRPGFPTSGWARPRVSWARLCPQ